MLRLLRRKRNCHELQRRRPIFGGFLSRFSHDRALNTISHGMQKYPVDDYFKVPLASCWQSAQRHQIFAAITKMRVVFLQLLTKLVQPEHLFKRKTSVVCCKFRQHVKSKSWEGAHQPITALHFTLLAYWPRQHATTYFNRS